MEKIKQFLLISLLGMMLFSCVEEIDISSLQDDTFLVVQGQITNELKRHEVLLTKSGQFKDTASFLRITGAEVIITEGQHRYYLQEESPGRYLSDSLSGIPGKVYRLLVSYDGQMFEAADTMPALPEAFEPAFFSKQGNFLDLEYRRHQFGFASPHKWELFVIRDPIDTLTYNIDINRVGLQVGVDILPPFTYRFTYFTHPSIEVNGLMNFDVPHFYGFNTGFKVVQKKYNLSEAYYAYLRSLFMETEWRGTLFPSTPANLQGNVSNGALGFFSASSVRGLSYVPQ